MDYCWWISGGNTYQLQANPPFTYKYLFFTYTHLPFTYKCYSLPTNVTLYLYTSTLYLQISTLYLQISTLYLQISTFYLQIIILYLQISHYHKSTLYPPSISTLYQQNYLGYKQANAATRSIHKPDKPCSSPGEGEQAAITCISALFAIK